MATTSSIEKNNRRKATVLRFAAKRKALKAIVVSPKSTDEEKAAAVVALQKLPRNASPTRVRNRCNMTGRARAYLRTFGLSRIALRELALEGKIPGVRKASW
jgi:small subunit ribosomal protein S14